MNLGSNSSSCRVWTPDKYIRGSAELVSGTFAPVYWEPLGVRGDRMVVGVLVQSNDGLFRSAKTIMSAHKLAALLGVGRGASAHGVISFAMDYLEKRLQETGLGNSVGHAAFATMRVGGVERISASSEVALVDRAVRLCSVFELSACVAS